VTDGDGYYSAVVEHGWSATVTPQRLNSSFEPLSRSYSDVTSDQTDHDYTGTLTSYDIYVDDDTTSPGDGSQERPFGNLQNAINAANDGNIVYVMSGTYEIDVLPAGSHNSNPIVINKNITLKGEDPDTTIIKSLPYGEDSGSHDYPLDIRLMEIRGDIVVEGFTFDIPNPVQDNDKRIQSYTENGKVFIKNNIFRVGKYSNNWEQNGHVRAIDLYCKDTGSGTIKHNQFLGEYGEGDYVQSSGLGFIPYNSNIEISNNVFGKLKLGIGMDTPESGAKDVIITNNTLDQNGYAINLVWRGGDLGTVRNNIMTNNDIGIRVSTYGVEINLSDYLMYDHNNYSGNSIDITVADGSGWPHLYPPLGTGSIEADPLYAGNGDYHLTVDSPCIDAGSSEGAPVDDIDGETRSDGGDIDMGVDEYIDSDSDNLPDYWEHEWFGNLSYDGTDDPDSDGATNLEEYQYGTDPNDPEDHPVGGDIFVDDNSGDDANDGRDLAHAKKTIQAGIDAATDGEIVVVRDGTYTGSGNKNLNFWGKAFTVRSQNGAENAIIDCENDGRGFYFNHNGTALSVVEGFTITNGHDDDTGGGMYMQNASPTIIDCIFSGNSASYGGAIRCTLSSPTITNCIISGNQAISGGGIGCWNQSFPTITDCIITENSATEGSGGGIILSYSSPKIANCTIRDNTASSGAGIVCTENSSPTITACTIIGNQADYCGGIHCYRGASPAGQTHLDHS
jgi:parallel beta-helix repeat protein/predicted outer membrane repeat protein